MQSAHKDRDELMTRKQVKPKDRLTQKQEAFCLNLFNGMSQREAYVSAGYSVNQLPERIDRDACVLAKNPKVIQRLGTLRKKAEDATIMDVKERKQRLTEIARARLTDFMEMGADGSWVNVGPESQYPGAVQELHSRTEYDDDSDKSTVYTSVKLHDPMKAIDLLNKMDGIYKPEGAQVNIDNRRVEINVISPEARQLTEAILLGARTEKT